MLLHLPVEKMELFLTTLIVVYISNTTRPLEKDEEE